MSDADNPSVFRDVEQENTFLRRENAELRSRLAKTEQTIREIECAGGDEGGVMSLVNRVEVAERENAELRKALETEREWVASLTKDNGLLIQAADATKSGSLVVSQAGRIEQLTSENAELWADIKETARQLEIVMGRYEFCKRHMVVGHHGLAPGITDISMLRIAIDCTLLSADEIIDRAMLPGTAANVQHTILTQKRPNHES